MAAHEAQVPGTRSPPHGPSAALAPNRGKCCRCGILPDRKTALEHREDGAAGKRTTELAPNRGKCCRCGILPDRKAALEHREDGAAEKRTTAPAPNCGKRCRCGGGRMVVWGRMKNLPRSSLSRGSDGILALIVWHFHVAGLYTPIYDGYCKSVRIRMRVP